MSPILIQRERKPFGPGWQYRVDVPSFGPVPVRLGWHPGLEEARREARTWAGPGQRIALAWRGY